MNASEITEKIKTVIEQIRPAIQLDGGDVDFVRYDDDAKIVYVTFRGACVDCIFSSYTLKMGVEHALRKEVDDTMRVVDSTARSA